MSAVAERLTDADLDRGIEIFSRVSVSHDAKTWTLGDVREPASLRLYRARIRALGARPGAPARSADARPAVASILLGLMSRSLLDGALAHHVWATLRLIDACHPLTREQLDAPSPEPTARSWRRRATSWKPTRTTSPT